MKSTMKYIITTSSFVTLHCFKRFVLTVVKLEKEFICWILLKQEYAMGRSALFKGLHELKWSNTSWHALCFLPPLIYITTTAVLIVPSPHTKSHQGRPYTVKTFREEFIKTNAPAYPSLAVISLYKLTHI